MADAHTVAATTTGESVPAGTEADELERKLEKKRAKIRSAWIAFVGRIDEAAACLYALQHEVLPAKGIPVQGIGRQPYRS